MSSAFVPYGPAIVHNKRLEEFTMTRNHFDADDVIAEQEAYAIGMVDAQEGEDYSECICASLRDAYREGQKDAPIDDDIDRDSAPGCWGEDSAFYAGLG